ncbi:unnamed protein product [Urochloa decumbens]|uniref:Isopenicillin N synthase-like Fe(2+) 2OG dioxygenase domain-containing protein n=1 Tax=Urochloa decumbens TaxID=240449 RepID=A0ABC8WC20_9POAL
MANSIPRINFAGIDQATAAGPGGDSSRWAAVRAVVMDALTEHGVFEAVMDGLISPELSAAMLGLGGATEYFFSLPPSTKALYANKEKPYLGYVSSSFLTLPYGTLCVKDPPFPDAVPALDGLMWQPFLLTVQAYTGEKVSALATVVLRMVLESLGATAESIEEQVRTTLLTLRLSGYEAPGTAEGRLGLPAHRDRSFLSVLTHNGLDGMEVELGRGDGGWVLTNGRVVSPLHRVVVAGDKTRYACILFSNPRDDAVVRAVDAQRPAMYRPFQYSDYNGFFFSKEHNENPNKLEAFAALGIDG